MTRVYSRVCPGLWVDVPDRQKSGTVTPRVAFKHLRAGCRATPGQGHRYPAALSHSSIRALPAQINGGGYAAWRPAGTWQAEIRVDGDGAESMWVRYLDDQSSDGRKGTDR